MAVTGWILDKSASSRATEPDIAGELRALAGNLYVCPVGELERLYSARSAREYDAYKADLHETTQIVDAPSDVLVRALELQRDLAHHHGMWHRTPIPDLLIAETALYHGLGVIHIDGHFERIAEVRPLPVRRLR